MYKQQELQLKTPIIILAIVALVFNVISYIDYFVIDYDGHFIYQFPSSLNIFDIFISVAPYVLLLIYLLMFRSEFKATVLVPVIFGLIAFRYIFILSYYFINKIEVDRIYLILYIFVIVAFICVTIDEFIGFYINVFLIIAIAAGSLYEFRESFYFFKNAGFYLEYKWYLYLVTWITNILGAFALYAALLLLGLKNPAIHFASHKEEEKKNAEMIDAEQALRLLKQKLDIGMITEEEYQAQRADIIRNL